MAKQLGNFIGLNWGSDVIEFGWDLNLKAHPKRATTINIIWLREEGNDVFKETNLSMHSLRNNLRDAMRSNLWRNINPILGFNLEGFPNHDTLNQNGQYELGSTQAIRRLRFMLKAINPQIVFLMETKLNGVRMENVRRCGFNNEIDV
ncbi:hypothetical protein Golax_021388 [Gossypium laxum]|uniref:Uncharacterized protein n=1 Tax=Gossypium laxum TaxID=34288 RepID=A0A7J9AMT2_9ROSI|nr:hypothetical protein [Gossypium laxum]